MQSTVQTVMGPHTFKQIVTVRAPTTAELLPTQQTAIVTVRVKTGVEVKSSYGVVSLPIGEDCSSEIGWYHGNGKPVIAVITDTGVGESPKEQYDNICRDWMVKGFLTKVMTNSYDVVSLILHDDILKNKLVVFTSLEDFRYNLNNITK